MPSLSLADEPRFLKHMKQAKAERLKLFTETLAALAANWKGALRVSTALSSAATTDPDVRSSSVEEVGSDFEERDTRLLQD